MQTTFMGVSYAPPKLKLLALRETPVQRSLTDSAACTNLELLSAMIGGPKQIEIAEAIVAHFKGDLHLLFQASVVELVSISGVGEATAARIKSALALSRRLSMTSMDRVTVNSPGDAAALCSDMSTFDVEHLRVIMLNTKSMVLGHCGRVQRFGQLIADPSGGGLSSCAATQCAKYCDCPQSSERGRDSKS